MSPSLSRCTHRAEPRGLTGCLDQTVLPRRGPAIIAYNIYGEARAAGTPGLRRSAPWILPTSRHGYMSWTPIRSVADSVPSLFTRAAEEDRARPRQNGCMRTSDGSRGRTLVARFLKVQFQASSGLPTRDRRLLGD